nr:class A beta-lactamase [Silvimonas soli]
MSFLSRRQLLTGAAALFALTRLPAHAATNASAIATASVRLQELENRVGGRLGVLALDTGTGQSIAHRADERFPMCSTFKFLLATAILARVDAHQTQLEQPVKYSKADLQEYAPIAREHLAQGQLSVGALCAAAVQYSDNTAANLLLDMVGGPAQLTAFLRAHGDAITRLDRNEPSLNTCIPGDPRDTTTPAAMLATMQRILLGNDILSAASRQQLATWLRGNTTGTAKIKAGLPADWQIGDKTGSGNAGAATNDIAIIWPPQRAPILVTAYIHGNKVTPTEREQSTLAEVGRLVHASFS